MWVIHGNFCGMHDTLLPARVYVHLVHIKRIVSKGTVRGGLIKEKLSDSIGVEFFE